jgi:hypothetical protein
MLFKELKKNVYVPNENCTFYKVRVIIDSENKNKLKKIINTIKDDLEFDFSFEKRFLKGWRLNLNIIIHDTFNESDFYHLTGEIFYVCSENLCNLKTIGFDFTP